MSRYRYPCPICGAELRVVWPNGQAPPYNY